MPLRDLPACDTRVRQAAVAPMAALEQDGPAMNTRLLKVWDTLRSSLWFVPAAMSLLATALAIAMIALDRRTDRAVQSSFAFVYGGGAEGARAVLSAIATSMITVAGVTFSITIVALTLASQQYGPRLLGSFLRDFGNQVVLGTFIATFLYCLLVLRTIRGGDDGAFVPQLSVTVGVVLALVSLAILIYFIHHVSTSIQASHVISKVSEDLAAAVDRLYPDRVGAGRDDACHAAPVLPAHWHTIAADLTGYVQAIDTERLTAIAVRNDLVVRLDCRPGSFVTDGLPIVSAAPPERIDDEIERALRDVVIVGRGQTTFQDTAFAIDQLVEVAVRALSPAVNDPFTAMACIDHLGAALRRLLGREIPSPFRYEADRLRVIAPRLDFREALSRAFDPIRESGRHNTAVMLRLLDTLRLVGLAARLTDDRAAVVQQATEVERSSRDAIANEHDRDRVATRLRQIGGELARGS